MTTVAVRRSTVALTCGILLGAALLLLVGHLALDAGSGREAPRWMLPVAIVCALAATFTGVLSGSGRAKR